MIEKSAWRKRLKARRRALSPSQRQRIARALPTRFAQQARAGKARRVGLFWPMPDEIDPRPLLQALVQRGVACYLPALPLHGRRLWFTRCDARSRWYHNRYQIPECRHPDRRRAEKLDLLLLPLVGVDRQGYRLGMGGGFYDATLASLRGRRAAGPWLVGLAYACQQVEALPVDSWDIRLDALLTEQGWQRFPAR
ncbi:5-formyltetrahydrofolate cyclo-ligase [Leeia aquatica]|uniref:5-formyltetrahydrofolate cyclo-ligase n=1 Tax=Leeia aquatica TaxID=2725557 RepID=UPI001980C71D|nr:5-formyltetrahydrofolate cyclo-ligase [Leeia aquatica]